jgi:hypothetical protein
MVQSLEMIFLYLTIYTEKLCILSRKGGSVAHTESTHTVLGNYVEIVCNVTASTSSG